MIDSGANTSIAGQEGIEILKAVNLKLDTTSNRSVATADTTKHMAGGIFHVPVEFKNDTKIIKFLAVPSLTFAFILGVDFWIKFNINLSLDKELRNWVCNGPDDYQKEPSVAQFQLNKTPSLDAVNVISNYSEEDNVVQSENSEQSKGIIPFDSLSKEQQEILNEVISLYQSLHTPGKLGRTTLIEHDIVTGDAQPTFQRSYPVSPAVEKRLHAELDRMLSLGVVEPSISPWRSPVVLVKKANGSDRLCIDSRKLNSITKHDAYPLPFVNHILDNLGRANFISTVDLKDAFWQVPLKQSAKEKTAFVVPGRGLFQLNVMGFGFRNSAQAMQRLVDRVVEGRKGIYPLGCFIKT